MFANGPVELISTRFSRRPLTTRTVSSVCGFQTLMIPDELDTDPQAGSANIADE